MTQQQQQMSKDPDLGNEKPRRDKIDDPDPKTILVHRGQGG